MLLFDAHLDLAMNAMEWNRDLRWSVSAIRNSEKGMTDTPDRGNNTVSFEAMRKGKVGLCMATQIARYSKPNNPLPGWNSPQQAWAQTQAQLAWYKAMEQEGHLTQITDNSTLDAHLARWEESQLAHPIGYILTLEGADSMVDLGYLEKSYRQGLRAIGPAHYGPGTYAYGTHSIGGIGTKGKALLKEMERFNLILDVTHLCDQSFWETLDNYHGPIWASHNNCRALVNDTRQFSDEQLKALIQRKAVIGLALDAWMMVPGWQRGISLPEKMDVGLKNMVNHLDHICQLAGNTDHVGIGSDLDGGFGTEQCPADVDTIADLQKIPELLAQRGYGTMDIVKVMHKNFLDFLHRAWSRPVH